MLGILIFNVELKIWYASNFTLHAVLSRSGVSCDEVYFRKVVSEFGLNIAKIYSLKLGYASYHVNIDG